MNKEMIISNKKNLSSKANLKSLDIVRLVLREANLFQVDLLSYFFIIIASSGMCIELVLL